MADDSMFTTWEPEPGVRVLHSSTLIPKDLADAAHDELMLGADELRALRARTVTAGELGAAVDWSRDVVRVGDRDVIEPRLTVFFADDPGTRYTYSGKTNVGAPAPPSVARLKAAVEAATGASFNACLANLYIDGDDAVGWHSDAEADLLPGAPIVTVSLGGTRELAFRSYAASAAHVRINDIRRTLKSEGRRAAPTPEEAAVLDSPVPDDTVYSLSHGDVLVMGPGVQQIMRHRLLRVAPPDAVAPRIVLTFRCVAAAHLEESHSHTAAAGAGGSSS